MNFSSAVSGIRNALFRQGVAADNVANLNTTGYRAKQVVNSEAPGGGVRAGEIRLDTAPGRPDILDLSAEGAAAASGSNVDLATEQTGMMLNAAQLKANAGVLKAQDALLGAVLDIRR